MAHQLVIRLLDSLDPDTGSIWAEWGLIHIELKRLLDVSVTPLSAIKALLESKYASLLVLKTIVLVPAQHVVLTQVNIPSRQNRHIQQALPYMLEEGLANEVTENFLALGPRQADGALSVAVVQRQSMKRWLTALSEAGIKADCLLPESLLIPANGAAYSLLVGKDRSWLRLADYQALVFANAQWPSVLVGLDSQDIQNRGLKLMSVGDDSAKQMLVHIKQAATQVFSSPDRENSALSAADLLKATQTESVETHWLSPLHAFVAEILAGNTAVNNFSLLQGVYKTRTTALNLGFNWKPLAAVAALWFVVLMAGQWFAVQRLNQETALYSKQAETLYRHYFPQDKRIVDVRSQTLAHIKRGGSGVANKRLFELLHPAGKSVFQFNQLNKSHPLRIGRLTFEQGQGALLLDIRAKQFSQLDQLKTMMEKEGLKVEIGSALAQSDAVESRLKITGT